MSRIGEVKFNYEGGEFTTPAARTARTRTVQEIGRIYLGQAAGFQPTPVEIVGFFGGMAMLVSGILLKKDLGTALGVVGGVAAGVSGGSALLRAIGGAQGVVVQTAPVQPAPAPPPTFTTPPPPPPSAPKTTSYAKILEYGKQYLPVLQELVKGVFSPAPAPKVA